MADIVLRGAADDIQGLRQQAGAEGWCACVAGALEEQGYFAAIRGAGFADVRLVSGRPAQSRLRWR